MIQLLICYQVTSTRITEALHLFKRKEYMKSYITSFK
jgi:hypothetical protein